MNLLLKEYVLSGDGEEAERCLRDLEVPHFHHEFVYEVKKTKTTSRLYPQTHTQAGKSLGGIGLCESQGFLGSFWLPASELVEHVEINDFVQVRI